MQTYCEIHGIEPISKLEIGMDFRLPQYREEVFMNFYEFHLKYRAHAGAVYQVFPYFAKKMNMTTEQRYWFAFLNGVTQHAITTKIIYDMWDDPLAVDLPEMQKWLDENWSRIEFDMDRKYVKAKLCSAVERYIAIVNKFGSQEEFFNSVCKHDDPRKNFAHIWKVVIEHYKYFGRLSTFSYLEYMKIMGLNIECNSLFLDDITGSMSHRNGILKVFGRDDLDWHKSNPEFEGHTAEHIEWAKVQGAELLRRAEERFKGEEFYHDVNYFTLETALCCYKGWHRKNRRYTNCYHDMFADRIWNAEMKWGKPFTEFWKMRNETLPVELRLEDNLKSDCGLKTTKQNWYRDTGEVPLLEAVDGCYQNGFSAFITANPMLAKANVLMERREAFRMVQGDFKK